MKKSSGEGPHSTGEYEVPRPFKKRQKQISVFYKGLGGTWKKLELYCFLLKYNLVKTDLEIGKVNQAGLEVV